MKRAKPRSYAEAIKEGFRVCEENFKGDLRRRGHLKLERIDKASGDREVLTVPFAAKFVPSRPRGYHIDRSAHMTPQEAEQFEERLKAKLQGTKEDTKPGKQPEPPGSPFALEFLVGTEKYREGRRNDLEEGFDEMERVLEASSTLLYYHAKKINDSQEVSFALPQALSDLLTDQAKAAKGLLGITKFLATPPKEVIPAAEAHFPSTHPAATAKAN